MVFLFWLTSLAPGLAVVRLTGGRFSRLGLFGGFAWAFVVSVAVLFPLTLTAFAMGLEVERVAYIYYGVVAVSVVAAGWPGALRCGRQHAVSLRTPAMWVAVIAVVATAMLVPGSTRYDAQMHAAKILQTLQVGFILEDPYSPLPVMQSAFHFNVLHYLHAIGAWSTDQAPLAFWDASAPFFRVLAFGGVEALALRVLRSTWLAAAAMATAAVGLGTASDSALPAVVAALIVLPFVLLRITETVVRPTWRHAVASSVCGLALSAIHVGHWAIYSMCLIPVLMVWGVIRLRAGLNVWGVTSVLAGWAVGLPLFVVTAIQPNHVMAQMGAELRWELSTFVLGSYTVQMLSLSRSIWMIPVLFAGAAFWFVRPHRRTQFTLLAGAFVIALQFMLNPLVFAVTSERVPYWMFRRLEVFASLTACLVVPALLAFFMRHVLSGRVRHAAFATAVIVAILAMRQDAIANRRRDAVADRQALEMGGEVRHLLAKTGVRPLLCADRELSLLIPAVRRAAVMAPSFGNTNPADPGVPGRAAACAELLSDDASSARRKEIVGVYGVDYLVVRKSLQTPPLAKDSRMVAETSSLFLMVAD